MLINLLDNAVKYSANDNVIVVELERRDNHAVVSVTDYGIGIPANELEQIFERFYRVDKGRSRAAGGTGLGLAIVKKLVEEHVGTIRARNRKDGGAMISIRLPLNEAAREQIIAKAPGRAERRREHA